MEHIKFTFSATRQLSRPVQVGVVASGDLEVLFQPDQGNSLVVTIISSSENSEPRWQYLFERMRNTTEFPSGSLLLHDSAATPGLARLRIEQAFEEAADE
ncbi:MAG: Malonate decarboxylase acyl carrier protein [Candidatus Celerinatantimonas neptuna]|nr:MAG: Malonate decarboxylase acyl carrier protein [Candidatus Celerinatantimonas neptuna]